ncbi:MAG: hypothetical protein PHY99_08130 [Bacteroidales bacterium]|nr:hypothetical protein [Bacteroidales bacterium]
MPQKKNPGKVISMPVTPENQIRTRARNLTIGDCWITADWEETREGNILVTRRHNQGGITFGIYLIDLALLGLKDTFYQFNMPPSEFDDFIRQYTEEGSSVKIDYTLVHNIIYGAIEYAEEYGFRPHKDFSVTQYILEEDTEEIPLIELEFGEDGLPTVFTSTEEPRIAEIRQLERLVGKGNFQVIDLGDRPDWDPDESLDEDDEEYEEPEVDPELVEEYLDGVDWFSIYKLCDEVFSLEPWGKLSETDIFAIKLPGSGREFFVSVMGSLGEMFAISFYEGQRAIYKFFEMQDDQLNYHPTTLLSIPHFMISWEEKEELDPIQATIFDKLKIQYEGDLVWPQINQIKPGYIPGFADVNEFRNIGILLTQCLDILPRAMKDRTLLWEHPEMKNSFLFRMPERVHREWIWHDEFREPTYDPTLTKAKYDWLLLKQYNQLPVIWETLQVDIILQPFPIPDKDGTLKFHFMLVGLDPEEDQIIIGKMLEFRKRYETILNNCPNLIMNELIALGGRPGKIEYRNPDLILIVNLFKDLAGTEVVFKRDLEPLGEAIVDMIDQIGKMKSR